jgi:hypothetical protein
MATAADKPKSNAGNIIAGIVLFVLACAVYWSGWNSEWVGAWALSVCPSAVQYCHHAPFLVGAIALLFLWVLYWAIGKKPNPLEVVRGVDQRWSSSKLQFFLWTVMVIFSYASVYAALIGVGALAKIAAQSVGSLVNIPTNLLLAMGFSVTTALAAKGITVNQLNNQATAKENVATDDAKLGDLVKDDGGAIDLTKVQMLGWTVVALGGYFSQVVTTVVRLGYGSPATEQVILPNIDTSLMVLMGFGQAAYLAKKMIATTTPAISEVVPSLPAGARPESDVTLKGSAFGTAQGDPNTNVITFNGLNTNFPVKSWSDKEITFTLQRDSSLDFSPGKKRIGVTLGDQKSNSYPMTVLRKPSISDFTWTRDFKTFEVTGEGFGDKKIPVDVVKLNDTVAANVPTWTDKKITFDNPDLSTFKAGKPVKVKLYLDGEKDQPTTESSEKPLQ